VKIPKVIVIVIHELLRSLPTPQIFRLCTGVTVAIAVYLFSEHLSSESSSEVNINESTRSRITKSLDKPSRYAFAEAEKHIYELMKKNSYQRFIVSDQYKIMLEKALVPETKKR
jgi:hypothetical protein